MSIPGLLLTDGLLQEAAPRSARGAGKVLLSVSFLLAVGLAVFLSSGGQLPATGSGSGEESPALFDLALRPSPARAWQALAPATVRPPQPPAVGTHPFVQPARFWQSVQPRALPREYNMDPVAAAAYQGAARPSAAFQQMQCEELSDFQKVAECMKTELQQLVSDPNSANWDMFASNFTVLDQSGAQVKGLGPIPLDVQMLKFFKMALGLGQLPIDIKIEFNAEGPRAASNHFLASRWKVQLGGMETPFAFLQPRQVDMDAEVVFHVNNKNKIDYMRIDKWLVNGHQRYPAEPSLQELTPATPVVFSVQTEEPEKEVDIYRDTLLRYAGYLNEVGEAFRPIVPGQLVTISYALALTYVMADALDKGSLTAKIPRNVGLSGCGLAAVIDTLTFQLVASIIIPGFTINRWVALSTYLVSEQIDVASKLAANLDVSTDAAIGSLAGVDITCNSIAEKIPTALGLALIPLIVKPIDGVTEQFLDSVVRPAIQNAFPKCALPFCNTDECDVI